MAVSLTEAQKKELEKAKEHIGWALSKISELQKSPSHTTLQQINEALYYSRDNLRTFSELIGWRLTGAPFGPPGGEEMAKLEDFMPQDPKVGPPLPKFLNIKWPTANSSSNPGDKEEIRNLLEAHTTVESWGEPCISSLARLMGQSIPTTREEKAHLIRQAEEYISSNPGARFPGRYSSLPEACACHTPGCGYRIESPGTHCYNLTCPKCGAKLWREK